MKAAKKNNALEGIKKEQLKHLAGTVSEPFALGDRRRVVVIVIDERGNELMRVVEAR